MPHISIFLELTRLKKPIGFMLLFWPCIWGLTIAYDFENGFKQYLFYTFLFLSGSVVAFPPATPLGSKSNCDFNFTPP